MGWRLRRRVGALCCLAALAAVPQRPANRSAAASGDRGGSRWSSIQQSQPVVAPAIQLQLHGGGASVRGRNLDPKRGAHQQQQHHYFAEIGARTPHGRRHPRWFERNQIISVGVLIIVVRPRSCPSAPGRVVARSFVVLPLNEGAAALALFRGGGAGRLRGVGRRGARRTTIPRPLCSAQFSTLEAQLWMCAAAMSSVDHIQRRAPNSPE